MNATERKPNEEIVQSLSGVDKVFILGCMGCPIGCDTGGQGWVDEMTSLLTGDGKEVTGSALIDMICNKAIVGIKLGRVLDVQLELDVEELEFHIPVLIEIEPERIQFVGGDYEGVEMQAPVERFVEFLAELRAVDVAKRRPHLGDRRGGDRPIAGVGLHLFLRAPLLWFVEQQRVEDLLLQFCSGRLFGQFKQEREDGRLVASRSQFPQAELNQLKR